MGIGPEPPSCLSQHRDCGGWGERRAGRAGLYVGRGRKSSLSRHVAAEVFPHVFMCSDNKALQQKQLGTPDPWGLGKGKQIRVVQEHKAVKHSRSHLLPV